MDQGIAVQTTVREGVCRQVAIGSNIFPLRNMNGERVNIALPPDQPAYWDQLS